MRALFAAVLLALAFTAQASFETEPVAPTDKSYVVLQVRHLWRDGCLPIEPRMTRAGKRIEVRFRVPRGVGCTLAIEPWHADAPIGLLPAGEYEVTLNVDDFGGLETIATRTLVVRESEPAFRIEPDIVSTAVTTDVQVADLCFSAATVVRMNGVIVPSRTVGDQCGRLVIPLPPHAAGAVNLRIKDQYFDDEVIASLRYIDPVAIPDPSLYERVLVPVLYTGGGAFGSQWVTEVEMINTSQRTAHFLPDVAKPLTSLVSQAKTSLDAFGNRPSGMLLFVPRGFDIRFGGIIRDLSRDASQWGAELPIVRERNTRTTSVTLANVPFDDRYRVLLRVYGIDGYSMDVHVTAAREGQSSGKSFVVTGPCAAWTQCNTSRPAFASIDLTSEFASLAGEGRFDVTVLNSRAYDAPRMWAFVSVTNNETQHVTIITPQ